KANSVPDGSIGAAQIANGSLTADKFANSLFNSTAWLLGGNSGTSPASQFLGTTDNQPLVFRANNAERMRLLADGRVGIGTTAPAGRLEVVAPVPGQGIRVTGTGVNGPSYGLFSGATENGVLALALALGQYSSSANIGDLVLRSTAANSKLLLQNGAGAA